MLGKLTLVERESLRRIKSDVEALLREHNRVGHIIYRTNQADFGYENPPHNLVAKRSERVVHVFLDFDGAVSAEALPNIWAVPDEKVVAVPKLPATKLSKGVERVDLQAMGSFRFADVGDLGRRLAELLD